MEPSSPSPHEVVFGTGRAEIGAAVAQALRDAGIPFQTGIQASPSPRMIFTVAADQLLEAQDVVAFCLASNAGRPMAAEERPETVTIEAPAGAQDDADDEDDEAESDSPAEQESQRIAQVPPWKTIGACAFVVFVHLCFVLSFGGQRPPTSRLADLGALVDGRTLREPWRLVTSLFLHVDPPHVLWNGLSMTVFAVPLVATLGGWTTSWVYLLSGISGALLATAVNPEGTVTVGSSGAVAGLFGCWLVGALRRVWNSPRPTGARLRVLGIGMLVLPTLLSATTPDGGKISVASHVGGALAGIAFGILLGLRSRPDPLADSPAGSAAWPH